MDKKLWFRNVCRKNSLKVSDEQLNLVQRYVELLREWNQKVNLVSRRDEEHIWEHHILGSMAFLFHFSLEQNSSVLDLGTGGGLPGIPLKIFQPSLDVTLLDSIQKKIKAVDNILAELKLENIRTICGRAEQLSRQKEMRGKFHYVIARAVGKIQNVVKWCKPMLSTPSVASQHISASTKQMRNAIRQSSILLLKGGELFDEVEDATKIFKPNKIAVNDIIITGNVGNILMDKKLVIVQLL